MTVTNGSQPRGRRGTVGHPYTALDLRLVLAAFGLVMCVALLLVALKASLIPLAIAAAVLIGITVVDLAVILVRRHRRDPEQI
jgi:hypothetical protein